MHKMSFKNEKILALSIDLLVITLCLSITYVFFEYPHLFHYFQEVEEAKSIIDPKAYMVAMDVLNQKFDYVLFEVAIVYFFYETIGLLCFRQTVGRKLFSKKVALNFETKFDFVLRCLLLPVRTFIKILSVIFVVPVFIIGLLFLLGKKDCTLLDILFLTKTVDERER